MTRLAAATALAAVAAFVLAGCASGPAASSSTTGTDAVLVTRPDDYSADANATNASKPHLHDYWNGAPRLVVLDAVGTEPQPGLASGDDQLIQTWRPDSGNVVPQGTARVEVTFNWTVDSMDLAASPSLWVKTASDNEAKPIGPVQQGVPVGVPSTNDANDLPHQLLSAWVFEFHASGSGPGGTLRMKGEIHAHVEAVRGLDIPLYPGHPDRWDGKDDLGLVSDSVMLAYLQDLGDGGCDGMSCPKVFVPADGLIVPPEAQDVVVWLNVTYGSPTTVALTYHGGEGRAFHEAQPVKSSGKSTAYILHVDGNADGPYAKQSQWEFATRITGPLPDGVAFEEVHVDVHALRHGAVL